MVEGQPSDAVQIEAGGCMGNLVGRTVASDLCTEGEPVVLVLWL